MGRQCAVHTHREDVPIEVHHIWPVGMGGPDVKSNRVALCANAHGSVHALLDAFRRAGLPMRVPWEVRRRFGPAVRHLAVDGWDRWQAGKS